MKLNLNILLIGPKAYTLKEIGGASVLFQTLVNEINSKELAKIKVLYYSSSRCQVIIKILRILRLIPSLLSSTKYSDIVSLHCSSGLPFLGLVVFIVCKVYRKKIILRQFGSDNYKNSILKYILMRWLTKRSDLVLVETKYQIEKDDIWKGANIRQIANNRPNYKRTKSFRRSCKKFIYIGQIHPYKGIYTIINAVKYMKLEYPVGFYGPIAYGIGNNIFLNNPNVSYLGILEPDKIMQVLEDYDVLLMPTFWPSEGHPGVIIEALQAGLPVIATSWRAIGEIIDNNCGFLIPVNDSNALRLAMEKLIKSPDIYMKLSYGALEKAKEFSSEIWAMKFIEYCRQIYFK